MTNLIALREPASVTDGLTEHKVATSLAILRFDILRMNLDDEAKWLAAEDGLEKAKALLNRFAAASYGRYYIWDRASCQIVHKIDIGFQDSAPRALSAESSVAGKLP